ncbi:Hypothetical protein HVR_LOCUS199 [uncultured virus]|nr:Hypothetical protein HVR_LOCUS199 [uncultured virus]
MSSFNVTYKRVDQTTVKATLTLTGTEKKLTTIPIIVLDVSGSMAGTRMNECLKAVNHILSKVGRIHFITYYSGATDYDIITKLPLIRADGMTSFKAAYDQIIQVIRKNPGPSQVVFFTDGEDTISGRINGQVDIDREKFRSELKGQTCVIHTIGIECESHTQHMLDLSRCGSSEGTYGYFSKNVVDSYLREAERLVSILGHMVEIEFRGVKYFLGSDPVTTYIQDSEMDCGSPDTIDEIDYLAHRVNEVVRKGKDAQLKEVQLLRDHAQKIFDEAGRQPRVIRKTLRERLTPIHELIADFYQLVHSQQTITHEKLALLNVAARDARSNRFVKKVVDRTEQNLAIIEREDSDLLKITQEMGTLKLDDQPSDMTCMLTCMETDDLLRDGDCMGIGVRAEVREACIMDPTLLKICEISTSNFGCAAFLEAAEYAASRGVQQSYIQGGIFNSKEQHVQYGRATDVVMDSSRVAISGVLPLYLNATHWKVAKLYLRRMAGHLCCKDPLLGTNKIIFYTYLHVYRFCRLQETEFYAKMTGLLRETLEKIYETMRSVIPSPDSFCGMIAQRMPDVVPSVTLLEEAYSALSLETQRLYLREYMVEEKLRRKKTTLRIEDVCSFDFNTWIEPFLKANTPNENASVYAKLLSVVATQYPEALSAFKKTIGSQQETAAKETTETKVPDPHSYEPIITLPGWMDGVFTNLSLERRALIALQVCELSNMTDFVQKYKDIFYMTEEIVRSLLQARCVEYIKIRRASELTSIIDNLRRNETCASTVRLRRGVSLLERVAILHGNCYVGRNITEFASTITSFEELKMLVTGQYDISKLIDFDTPIIISTVMDINSHLNCLLPYVNDEDTQVPYEMIWIPNRRTLKKWCQTYSHGELMSVMHVAKLFFDKYCV